MARCISIKEGSLFRTILGGCAVVKNGADTRYCIQTRACEQTYKRSNPPFFPLACIVKTKWNVFLVFVLLAARTAVRIVNDKEAALQGLLGQNWKSSPEFTWGINTWLRGGFWSKCGPARGGWVSGAFVATTPQRCPCSDDPMLWSYWARARGLCACFLDSCRLSLNPSLLILNL